MKNRKKEMRIFTEFAAFTFPAAAVMLLVFFFPFVLNFVYSFTDWNGIAKNINFIGLSNFRELFCEDADFWRSAAFTLKYAVLFVLIGNAAAVWMAIFLNQQIRGAGILRAAFFVSNTFSLVVVGFMWNFIFTSGFAGLFEKTGFAVFDLPWLSDEKLAFYTILLVSLWQAMGYYMVIYLAGLQTIPDELLEAAKMDGAGFLQQVRYVLLPMLLPSFSTCLFLAMSNAFKVYDIVLTLTGGGPGTSTNSIAVNIYKEAFSFNRYGYGTAKSLFYFLTVLVISLLQQKWCERMEKI